MFNHPDYVLAMAREHQNELIEEAERRHLLRLARQWLHASRAQATDRRSALEVADRVARTAPVAAAPVSALAGTLATCGRHVAGSAR